MTQTLKVLGQSSPAAITLTALYTVPSATSTTVSSITVCNTNATAQTFRISVAVGGAADAISQYLYYDLPIAANDTFVATMGVSLAATDVVRVYASTTNMTFQAFGVEIS